MLIIELVHDFILGAAFCMWKEITFTGCKMKLVPGIVPNIIKYHLELPSTYMYVRNSSRMCFTDRQLKNW